MMVLGPIKYVVEVGEWNMDRERGGGIGNKRKEEKRERV